MSNAGPPIIDITDLERTDALIAIDDACRDWGFFQLVGHGIGEHLIVALRRQMREYFAQSLAAKHENLRTADNPWGFYDRELTKHTPDWKQIYDYGPPDGGMMRPQWPAALPEFQPVIRAFYDACDALALRLLGALSTNLGMPATFLDALFRPAHTSFLRPTPRSHLGVNSHTDSGALTLLLQDEEPGLEVLHGNGWRLVEPRQDTLVVNIGDMVQVWSNDVYRAALHRGLANADAERFSVPFFFNPSYDCYYAPLPSMVDGLHPPRYRPINWGEFRAGRAAGDYANQGKYLQISHYCVEQRREAYPSSR